ncbi:MULTISPECIES: hypothetical protein [unclassified Ruminococcus]|uniref:hypothetical protein n=1 Tax=unclassified Ruminococcus TaxID=2608920 RepID=UPI00210A4DEA|nr:MULTISPECIES: hypothetical protein [unclassified Ruminococcus]MCQ4022483.1 hypothetical protein [Ruminococcus sp. zg-924]MCQ4115175.1 hypothetical protein [Ruminococcus sp. zg-921]
MADSTNKKRTAVIAAATAAALVLTGTVAWNMATDQTKLNEFTEKDPGKYEVELDENFDKADPWLNKDVFVKNNGDNPVIVRVRLEEFYDLTYRNGTDYNVAEGYSQTPPTEGSSAIFKADALTASTGQDGNNYKAADSSTHLTDKVALNFNEGVATMAEYNAMDDTAKAAIKWVVDSDGWCYYTRALLAGETTEYLLDDVDFNEEIFDVAYDAPYNLDYKINVRLQAISADLVDYGAKDNKAQWTNVDGGREIAATDNPFEITANSDITDDAENLVIGIKNTYTNPYANDDGSIAVKVSTFAELEAAINDPTIHSILLVDDILIDSYGIDYSTYMDVQSDKLIDLGHYTINKTHGTNKVFRVGENVSFALKHGTILCHKNMLLENEAGSNVELVDIQATADECTYSTSGMRVLGDIKLYNSSFTFATTARRPIGAVLLGSNANLYLNNSSITSNNVAAITSITQRNVSTDIVIENNSVVQGVDNGILLWTDWTLTAKDSEIIGRAAISENHNYSPKSVNLENTTLTATELGYYKVGDYPLVMKNCVVNTTGADGVRAGGLFIRSGDITLDNVNININKGTGADDMLTDEYLNTQYASESQATRCFPNYDPLQIVLNSYDSINLNIIGGSYTTNVDGAKSVYIYDEGYNIHTEGSGFEYPYTFANTITVSGAPTFTPTFTFADSYKNTTVTK